MNTETREALARSSAAALANKLESIEAQLGAEELSEDRMVELTDNLSRQVKGVATVSELLPGEARRTAELLLVPVLQHVRWEAPQEEIERALDRLPGPHTGEFSAALVAWLSHRPSAAFMRFSPELDPKLMGDRVAAELAEILARLWVEAVQESAEAPAAIARVAELRRGGAGIDTDRLEEEVRRSLSDPVAEEEGVKRMQYRLGLLKGIADDGLLSGQAADIALEFAERALSEPPPGVGPQLADLLQEICAWAAPDATQERLKATAKALAASPWIAEQSPTTETLRLQLDAGLAHNQKKRSQSPLDPAEVAKLADEYGPLFVPGLEVWLKSFRPSPAAAAKALRPYLGRQLPQRLADAVEAYRKKQGSAANYRLVRELIEWPPRHRPVRPHLLVQMGIRDADPEKVTSHIIDRFKHAHNREERAEALAIWQAFSPMGAGSRRRLIREVFIPLARMGVGGYELCLKYLNLCKAPPHGTKGELLDALGDRPSRKLGRKMDRRMKEVGLKPRGRGK